MKENMDAIFFKLENRVLDSLSKTDLTKMKSILSSINEPTLVSGVGGSSVVSHFLSKVLREKNHIMSESITPRDLLYRDLACYKNIIACSYSGNNFGVETAFDNHLNKYLLSMHSSNQATNLTYKLSEVEHSFISLSSTLIPMSIALFYYCDDMDIIKEILSSKPLFACKHFKEILIGYDQSDEKDIITPTIDSNFFSEQLSSWDPLIKTDSYIWEILSGYESSTAAKFLESTMVESGMLVPVVHDKYDYCHGRSTLSFNARGNLLFFDSNKELDKLLLEEIDPYYQLVVKINKKYDDEIINDYYFTYISMLLCRSFAKKQDIDLANVNYSPVVKKLYKYKGEM